MNELHVHNASRIGIPMNLARFDLVSIRLVVLCAERGSLAAAAKLAHMSKSAASHRLANLELSFGQQLFHRDHRGLHLTEAGVVFAERGQSILNEVRRLGQQLACLKSASPSAADTECATRTR